MTRWLSNSHRRWVYANSWMSIFPVSQTWGHATYWSGCLNQFREICRETFYCRCWRQLRESGQAHWICLVNFNFGSTCGANGGARFLHFLCSWLAPFLGRTWRWLCLWIWSWCRCIDPGTLFVHITWYIWASRDPPGIGIYLFGSFFASFPWTL